MYHPLSPFYDRIPFGTHVGRYLSEIIFHDPGWVMWAKSKGVLRQVFYREPLESLLERLSSIKIPDGRNPVEKREADYQYNPKSFLSSVTIRRVSVPVNRQKEIVKTLPELDIAFCSRYRKTIYKKNPGLVAKTVIREYFPGYEEVPADEAVEFFTNEENFYRGHSTDVVKN